MTMNNGKLETVLGEGTILKGDLVSTGIIRLDGKFGGSVNGGSIIIGKAAVVEADIKCVDMIIYGKVKGNVTADKNVEIQPSGELIGNLKASSSNIMKGARFVGKCDLRIADET